MATITQVYDGSSWRKIKKIYTYDAAATAWRLVRYSWVHDGTNWRQVHTNAFIYNETITTPTSNYDLRTKLTTAGWNGTDDVEASITVNPAVVVYSTSTPQAAFKVSPALPTQSTVTLTNQGTIVGKGGSGGNGGSLSAPGTTPVPGGGVPAGPPAGPGIGAPGENGGTAISTSSPLVINNTGGVIAGGGGGGGGGAGRGVTSMYNTPIATGKIFDQRLAGGSGGSGGAGSSLSPAARGNFGDTPSVSTIDGNNNPTGTIPVDGSNGNDGTDSAGALVPGVTALFTYTNPDTTIISGAGGAGGARGSSGSNGGTGSTPQGGSPVPGVPGEGGIAQYTVVSTYSAGSGGAAGVAISGNPLVTLPAPQTGTINGPRV
jgi:hypothetical protein